MLVGYARVSTQDQKLSLQNDALKQIGCERIFTDQISGATIERIGLNEALTFVRSGDTLVVWKLDRLGRSLQHLVETVNKLKTREIGFKSIQENIDTTTSTGKLFFHVFAALAEFELSVIRERTFAGLQAARTRGRFGGRKPKMTPTKISMAKTLIADKNTPIKDICKTLDISRATLYNYIGENSTVCTQ